MVGLSLLQVEHFPVSILSFPVRVAQEWGCCSCCLSSQESVKNAGSAFLLPESQALRYHKHRYFPRTQNLLLISRIDHQTYCFRACQASLPRTQFRKRQPSEKMKTSQKGKPNHDQSENVVLREAVLSGKLNVRTRPLAIMVSASGSLTPERLFPRWCNCAQL